MEPERERTIRYLIDLIDLFLADDEKLIEECARRDSNPQRMAP